MKLRSLWKRIVMAGVDPSVPASLARRIIVMNKLSFTIFFVTCPYIVIFWTAGATLYSLITIWIAGAYLLFIGLNALRRYDLSRMWMILHFNAAATSYASTFGEASGIHLCLFTLICFPLVLFELKDRLKIVVGMLVPVACYTLLGATDFGFLPAFPVSASVTRVIYWAIVYSNFLMLAAAVFYFYYANEASERKLESLVDELRRERDFTGIVVDSIDALVMVADAEGRIIRFNGACQRVTGYSFQEVVGRRSRDFLFTREDALNYEAALARLAQAGRAQFERDWVTRDGRLRRISWSNSVITDARGQLEYIVATGIDITERVQAERLVADQQLKLVTASKMSALGEMASGIAHEVNNPLTVIRMKAEHLQELADGAGALEAGTVIEFGAKIETMAVRIHKIVQSLRSFAREVDRDPFAVVPVRDIIEDALGLCRERFYHHRIQVLTGPAPAGLDLECRLVQVSQVLLNLLGNSYDAVEPLAGDRWVRIEAEDSGGRVLISVSDCGNGVSAGIRDKIFQPFFTTKGPGKGTGLGLSISKGIVESHGGSIWLDSSPAHTRFVISLPKRQRK